MEWIFQSEICEHEFDFGPMSRKSNTTFDTKVTKCRILLSAQRRRLVYLEIIYWFNFRILNLRPWSPEARAEMATLAVLQAT